MRLYTDKKLTVKQAYELQYILLEMLESLHYFLQCKSEKKTYGNPYNYIVDGIEGQDRDFASHYFKLKEICDDIFSSRETSKLKEVKTMLLELIKEKVDLETLGEKVENPLRGLKIAPYYGCTLVRPKEVTIDQNPERPTVLSDLIFALGAEAVEDPYMTECCGSYLTVKDKHLVADRTNKIIGSMGRKDVDLIMVSCPLCQFNLDRRQKEARELNSSLPEIPIVYFTQLMALAFGVDEQELGFQDHFIDPTPVLKRRQLLGTKKKVPAKVKKK